MNSNKSDRRRFLKKSAALAAVSVGAVLPGTAQEKPSKETAAEPRSPNSREARAYGERSPRVNSIRRSGIENGPRAAFGRYPGLRTPLQDSAGIITPSPLHYTVTHGYAPPDIDPQQHRLMVHGLVDRPLIFSMEELRRLPHLSEIYFLECNANSAPSHGSARNSVSATPQETHGFTSCSEWTGVSLSVLLKEAGIKSSGSWIIAEGAEPGEHTKSIPIEKAMDDVLVAYAQNGEALRPEQGFPLRLVVPGWEGINSVKWLRRIKVVDQPHFGMRESTKYPSLRMDGKARWFQFEMGPKSVITFPAGGHRLTNRGFHQVTGLAWSGGGTIKRVEVSTDGGKTWKDAQLQEPMFRKAHTRFRFDWNWNGEEAVLQSRCTDDRDETQPSLSQMTEIWRVGPEYYQQTTNMVGHFNTIQPWRVGRDGSVTNALFS